MWEGNRAKLLSPTFWHLLDKPGSAWGAVATPGILSEVIHSDHNNPLPSNSHTAKETVIMDSLEDFAVCKAFSPTVANFYTQAAFCPNGLCFKGLPAQCLFGNLHKISHRNNAPGLTFVFTSQKPMQPDCGNPLKLLTTTSVCVVGRKGYRNNLKKALYTLTVICFTMQFIYIFKGFFYFWIIGWNVKKYIYLALTFCDSPEG